ncbi:Disease resistance protein rga2 [Thalictrum thalictroides]|uniref:Disease resistance protein rga2 n=1 Tax=Thalictrum thalictroides TaxID=46969 RepID=A0A7J6W899_THATH|nr:Disease resistance protein rga2 [Thalictrum thalictroides]
MVYWLLSSFVSATLQVMLDNLAELGKKAHKSVADVDNRLEMLKRTLVSDQSVIHDAEDKQLSGMEWQSLLQDLEKVGYQADDLIDDIAIKVLKLEGVGKTTLAQLVYNYNYQATEAKAVSFHLKMWISVTKDFDVIRLTRSIIEAANQESTLHLLNLDSLQVKLMKILHEKKFLLVLDDLWNEKREEWDLLLKPLRHGLKGSKIIITTGSYIVTSMVSKVEPYHLRCLSDEACWSLLKEEACGGINLHLVPELEAIGREISRKCKGLPWVAKKVGSILHSKVDEMEWKNVLDSRIWDLPEGGKYMIHNAIHHLAQSVCGERFLRVEDNDDSVINTNMRHLSLVCEKIQTKTFEASSKCKGLRTFLLSSVYKTPIKEVPLMVFVKLRSLRVLDLSGTRIEELTESVGNLKHLRFLDLSNTLLRWLPETMQELCLLQTLRIRNCSKLLSLPKSTWRLRSLQHLELDGVCQLTTMPSGLGKLTGLQTISEFIVGPESGQMKELKGMNNIRGSLCIKKLEKVNNPEEALEANLANKKYIERLELQWTSTEDAGTDEHVLDKLMTSPHASLKELIFRSYGGRMFPNWVSNPLFSKLQSISFYECNNCGLMPPLGQLPKLKFLKIVGMHELVKIEIFLGNSFQSLETLELRDMPKLESWVGANENNMVFRELTIVNSPQLVTLPSLHYLRSLKKLEFDDCPQLQSFSDERLSESVEYLVITECVKLEEQCKQDGGQDWMKIEHISHIEIDFQVL